MYVCMYVCIYIYIYRERERERETFIAPQAAADLWPHVCIWRDQLGVRERQLEPLTYDSHYYYYYY